MGKGGKMDEYRLREGERKGIVNIEYMYMRVGVLSPTK